MKSNPIKPLTEALLVEPAEAAAMLNIPVATLWALVTAKRLMPLIRLSRTCLRFRKSDVVAWVESEFAALNQQLLAKSDASQLSTSADAKQQLTKSEPWDRREWLAAQGMEG